MPVELPQTVTVAVDAVVISHLHADHFTEHGDERLLPVGVETFGQPLQASREVGIAFDTELTDRRGVVVAKER